MFFETGSVSSISQDAAFSLGSKSAFAAGGLLRRDGAPTKDFLRDFGELTALDWDFGDRTVLDRDFGELAALERDFGELPALDCDLGEVTGCGRRV